MWKYGKVIILKIKPVETTSDFTWAEAIEVCRDSEIV